MDDKILTFELTVQQANVILQALANAPYVVAAPIIDLMKMQASSQLDASDGQDPPSETN